MREWTLHICRGCGDYDISPKLEHPRNAKCPGRHDSRLVEEIVVVPKYGPHGRDVRSASAQRTLGTRLHRV